jgi:hypothetical protein
MKLQKACTVAAATPLPAPSPSGGGGEWTGSVTDSAGVAMVSNPAEGTWGPGQGWFLEEEVRIGAIEGDPEYQFGQVGGIAVDSKGFIYVMDVQGQNLKVYDTEGSYVETVGQRGGGPGEFSGAFFILMGAADTLLVPDMNNRRVNVFPPDRSDFSSFPLSLDGGVPAVWASTPTGVTAYQIRPLDLPNLPRQDSSDAVVVFTTDGTVTDTLIRFPTGETVSYAQGFPDYRIFSTEAAWTLAHDGKLLYGMNNDYRIEVHANGELERVITQQFEPELVGQNTKDAIIRWFRQQIDQAGAAVPPGMAEQIIDALDFGEYLPAFAGITAGSDGAIWVQHIQAVTELSEEELESFDVLQDLGAPEWDVFDADGRYLGVVTMPRRFSPRLFRGDYVYGVWRDELDVQYVQRLKIVKAT